MDEARLELGLKQARVGVFVTLLGPLLLSVVPVINWGPLALISAALPGATILGLSNCRKGAPEVEPRAALVAWLSVVIATVLQFGVSVGIVALDVTEEMVGQLYLLALLFHLVSLQFTLVFATAVAKFVEAPDLAVRFRNLSLVAPIAFVGAVYVFILVSKGTAIFVLLAVTLTFLITLSTALGALASRVRHFAGDSVIGEPLTSY